MAGYIAGWRPASVPATAAGFARQVAAAAAPPTRARANALLWAAARLAAFGIPPGLEAVPEVLLHPSVIERFAAHRAGPVRLGAPHAADEPAVYRLAGGPARWPRRMRALPREHAKAPYSPAEIAGYLALADAQPAAARRMRAAGLVCLGAGAGLTGADLRGVRGTDVACRSGGLIVDVRGARPRAVPVLARYHQPLLAAAAFAGTGLVTGGSDPARQNVTTPLIRSLSGGAGLPRLEASRLRMTWLCDCAATARPGHLHARRRDHLLPAARRPARRAGPGRRGRRGPLLGGPR